MPAQNQPTFQLADRLTAARRGRFVGREAEIELFRSALLAAEPPFAVLHIYGPGGVGKSTLLREYARLATQHDRPVVLLDRNIEPSPSSFLLSLGRGMELEDSNLEAILSHWPPNGVLIIDTYEILTSLDDWLRETFLPQLPGHSLIVLGGRHPPTPAWRTDMAWAELTRIISLRNLRPEESQTYLTVCGIPHQQHSDVLAFTHGHPLALSLVADVLSQRESGDSFTLQAEPDVVHVLLERFVDDVPSSSHRRGLQVCTLAWATTEDMLTAVLDEAEVADIFEWLHGLSFIERGPYGLFPHDLARDVLDADFCWRTPDSYRELHQQVRNYLFDRFQRASGPAQQRLYLDIFFANRNDPGMKSFFAWDAMDVAYAEPVAAEDFPTIIDIVKLHEGAASAQLAKYWLQRQPQAFLVFRTHDGSIYGFMANLALHQITPEDIAIDPALPAAQNFIERYGPVRPGEEIVYLRFWMGRKTYQAVSPALNLIAINTVIYFSTHPKLAWSFIAFADPDFIQPHLASINMQRSPEADFEVGGHRYGVFTHDWRVESFSAWQLSRQPIPPSAPPEPPPPLLVLSQPEFEGAVRQALRDYTRQDVLATNPLMRSRLVVEATEASVTATILQSLLREAAETLTNNPKDEKFYRAIYYTYLEPASTQEQAAELLDLPFNTYRYHLTNGLKHITAWLWQRELYSFES